MTNLIDNSRTGPPLSVSWATDRIHLVEVNSFADAWVALATVAECHGEHVRCRVMLDGSKDWRSEDGRRLEELPLAECRDLDWAWAHRAMRENAAEAGVASA